MKQNVGSFDRILRFAIGSAFVVLGIAGYVGYVTLAWLGIGQALASLLVLVIGVIVLLTAATRLCLVYAALGISTDGRSGEAEATSGKPA